MDQRGHDRSSVFYFCVPNDNIVIDTLLDKSPVLREARVEMAHKPEDFPTSKEWSNGRIKITGRNAVFDGAKLRLRRWGRLLRSGSVEVASKLTNAKCKKTVKGLNWDLNTFICQCY